MSFVKRLSQLAVIFAFFMVIVWACTEDSGDRQNAIDAATNNTPSALKGSCDSEIKIGSFDVVIGGTKTSYVTGSALAGVVPSTKQTKVADFGSCKFIRQNNTFCDPLCEANMDCNSDGQCIAHPASLSLGAVSITGLVEAVEMAATPPAYSYSDMSLPAVPAEPGTSVQLEASGGDIPAFKLSGKGIRPLVVSDSVWNVAAGQATTINWEADSVSGATILISFGLDQHGRTPTQIVCEVEDTGSFVVSAEQIDQLIDLGSSVPTVGTIKRQTVDSVTTSKGCIEFTLFSQSKVEVRFTAP